ncbi:MAG: L-histidine N(alpha)-methyltransferase, partial [Planctomycetota bacterium]
YRADLCAGLREEMPCIPSKYLYDERGAALFEEICRLPEYYPTRTEDRILRRRGRALRAALPTDCHLVELGSGEACKTPHVNEAIHPAAYTPVDIAGPQLAGLAARFRRRWPSMTVSPVHADFTALRRLPPWLETDRPRVVFFPGSTIGNFPTDQAGDLLRNMASIAGPDGHVVCGFDLAKDPTVIHAAYNDSAGITAAFNRNLIVRARTELGWDLDEMAFRHEAPYLPELGRVEMRLIPEHDQILPAEVGRPLLPAGTVITTEYSHKYSPAGIDALLATAGLGCHAWLTDERQWFAVAVARPIN